MRKKVFFGNEINDFNISWLYGAASAITRKEKDKKRGQKKVFKENEKLLENGQHRSSFSILVFSVALKV